MTRTLAVALLIAVDVWGSEAAVAVRGLKTARADEISRYARVGEFDRTIPLVTDGGGTRTNFVLTNLDKKTIHFDLYFSTNDGRPMDFAIEGIGPVSKLYGALPVNQTISFWSEGKGEVVAEGYASLYTLDRPADQANAKVVMARLGGSVVVTSSPIDRAPFETVVPICPSYETRFSVPFDNRGGIRTALILVNDSTSPSPTSIVVRDENGKVIARDSFTLGPGKRASSGPLSAVYPSTADQSGVVQVSTSSVALSGIGLRLHPSGSFVVISSLSSDLDSEAPSAPASTSSPLPGVSSSCSALEGALVFASDGQYLGKITSNSFAGDSLGNMFGSYGSEFSATSIFNSFSKYGSEFSQLSAFNSLATSPPLIVIGGKAVAYLTVNPNKSPRVDTRAILACVGRR
jgi:hypothetical protein